MRSILSPLISFLENNETVIIGTIVEQSGSSPRGSGAKILVRSDGSLLGTIGGGDVEARCHQKAKAMLQSCEKSLLLSFNLSAKHAADAGLACGGALQVLLYAVYPSSVSFWQRVTEQCQKRSCATLITSLSKKENEEISISLYTDTTFIGATLPKAIEKKVQHKAGKSRLPYMMEAENEWRYYIEPQIDPGTLWLVGAGHVSYAVAHLADSVGFSVIVMDDRVEFANKERFPYATKIVVLDNFTHCFDELSQDDYVVIVTRGHLHDKEVLAQAIVKNPGYIGMIGSRTKRETVYAKLQTEGISKQQLDMVRCPIGLAIGADTPEEIAVSIIGELIHHRAGGKE